MSPHDEVRVVDENGTEVAPGEEGELLVRGPYTINGYYRAAEANARSFTPDGFYRSGDRVRIFTDGPRAGYVEVTGRIKDVIHRGGETVSASDLEEHLFAHPDIYAAAAVAIRTSTWAKKLRGSRFLRQADHAGRVEQLPGRARGVPAHQARHARRAARPAQDRGRQGGQEADHRRTERPVSGDAFVPKPSRAVCGCPHAGRPEKVADRAAPYRATIWREHDLCGTDGRAAEPEM
jgi:acyl-CoA synthetase (AMP-forming)/AMP-acid ligase II